MPNALGAHPGRGGAGRWGADICITDEAAGLFLVAQLQRHLTGVALLLSG